MDVYQMHPDHGRMIVHSTLEAESNHEHGWETVSKENYYREILAKMDNKKSEPVEDDERAQLVDAYKEKFGNPPHHRMKTSTIKAKLEEG